MSDPPKPPSGGDSLYKPSSEGGMSAPQGAEMDRENEAPHIDPVTALGKLSEKELKEIREMNVKQLSEFFRKMGLKEMPKQVQKHSLNGSVLHTLNSRDIDKMDFVSLGEAKALSNLAGTLSHVNRQDQRAVCILEKNIIFWGTAHHWYAGPLDACNRCSMKDHRSSCDICCDAICCSPKTFVELPESTIRVYRDHLEITYPRWRDHIKDKYRKLNHAFADTNEPPFKITVDNIDYSNIQDVDVEMVKKQEKYVRECADCCNTLFCKDLRREPHGGNFYWVNACQRCFGHDLFYKQRPDGYVTITLRSGDEGGRHRKIGVLGDVDELSRAILHRMEESQVLRSVQIQQQ